MALPGGGHWTLDDCRLILDGLGRSLSHQSKYIVCTGESVEVVVEAEDYLGILEGGYFIRFNAMAVSSDQQLAVMDT